MGEKKFWARSAVASVGTLALLGSLMLPAQALNKGTIPGVVENGCNVIWEAESVLDADLNPVDPKYGDLTRDDQDRPINENYQ